MPEDPPQPPPVPSPALFTATMECSLRGRRFQNVFTFVYGNSDWTYPKLFFELATQLATRTMIHRSLDVTCFGIVYKEYFPNPLITIPIPLLISGGQIGEAAPNSVNAVMKMKTGFVGRSKRGRKFIFGLPASFWNGMYLVPEKHRAISLAWSSLEQIYHPDFTDYPLTWGLLNRYVGGVKRLPIITNFWPFVDLTLNYRRMRHRHTAHYRATHP